MDKPIPANAVTTTKDGVTKVLYVPTEKAAEFHAAEEPFVLGQGGRNSGKSFALRWDAHLRNLLIPGHKALLLRRTFPQLRGSHFDRAEVEAKLLDCPKPFHRSEYYISYANGSKLQFGHCESDAAVMDYLSQEWDWIGFDELTTFTFDQFIRISASARTSIDTGRKAYVRAATNPIGIGASWVKRYFIDHSISEEENPDYRPEEWRNIQMNIADNPHANRDEYERKLLMLPSESLRRAYKDGEWLVEGQFFSEFRERMDGHEWHVIEKLPEVGKKPITQVPWIEIVRFLDWGYSEAEPGYVGWVAQLPDGSSLLFQEWVFSGKVPEQVAEGIRKRSEGMKIRYTIVDPMVWAEREGESIGHRMSKPPYCISSYSANNDRETGWVSLHSWLVNTRVAADGTLRPMLQFLMPNAMGPGTGVPYAIRTLQGLQVDPKKPSDLSQGSGVEDHAADGLRYWASNRPAPSRAPAPSLAHFVPEIRQAIMGYSESQDAVLGDESVRR